jgi:pimeloyl-ACP methyl ester carboxylesterase
MDFGCLKTDRRVAVALFVFCCTLDLAPWSLDPEPRTLHLGAWTLVAKATRHASAFVTSPDGIRIAYEVSGEGTPAVVLVHGWSCDRTYWKGQIQPFSRQYKVVAVDLAGHGESGLGRKTQTMAAFGGDVAAVVDKLGLKRVVLVGHSMGGDVIVEAARKLPGRVVGLVWVDTYRQLGKPRTQDEIDKFEAQLRTNFVETTRAFVRGMFPATADRALVDHIVTDMSSAPPDVAIGALVSAASFDRVIPGALKELKLPVVAINPDYRPTDVDSMERHGVEVVIMTGVGHFLMMEDPERFNPILKTVIEKLAR